MHRDLKLENVMLCNDGYLKLIDYGLAKILQADEVAKTFAGTCEYMAPEMLDQAHRQYDKNIDWWAVGILTYELLTGFTPFGDKNRHQIHSNIRSKKVRWSSRLQCSDELKDLVEKLLTKDPSARLGSRGGCQEVLSHPWFSQGDSVAAIERMELDAPIIPEQINEQHKGIHTVNPETILPLKAVNACEVNQKLFNDFDVRTKKNKNNKKSAQR